MTKYLTTATQREEAFAHARGSRVQRTQWQELEEAAGHGASAVRVASSSEGLLRTFPFHSIRDHSPWDGTTHVCVCVGGSSHFSYLEKAQRLTFPAAGLLTTGTSQHAQQNGAQEWVSLLCTIAPKGFSVVTRQEELGRCRGDWVSLCNSWLLQSEACI